MKGRNYGKFSTDLIRSDISQRFNYNDNINKVTCDFHGDYNYLHEIWNLPPLNLTPETYFKSNRTRFRTIEDNASKSLPREIKKEIELPNITMNAHVADGTEKGKKVDMTTRFRIDSANTDRRNTLKTGYFKKGPYSAPRPHHFNDDIHRHLDNLSSLRGRDFTTNYEKDPCNIQFKNEALELKITEPYLSPSDIIRSKDSKFNTLKTKDPKFDINLFHSKEPYQKGRSREDVLYDLIAQKTCIFPKKEKYNLQRPNIYDNKTIDHLEITRTGPRHKCLNISNRQ